MARPWPTACPSPWRLLACDPILAPTFQVARLSAEEFAQAFARANRGLKPDMLRVTTTRGNWLSEVWLCMDRAMEFTRCPAHQGGAAVASYVRIEPGPNIPNPRRSAIQAGTGAASAAARKPGLILDLDPNVQSLGNSAGTNP